MKATLKFYVTSEFFASKVQEALLGDSYYGLPDTVTVETRLGQMAGWTLVEEGGVISGVSWSTSGNNTATLWISGRVDVEGRRHGIPWERVLGGTNPLHGKVYTMESREAWHPGLTRDDVNVRVDSEDMPSKTCRRVPKAPITTSLEEGLLTGEFVELADQ